MNLMIEFAKEYRTNDFFCNLAHEQLKVAYKIMEYLEPEKNSDINQDTLNLIIRKDKNVLYNIFEESNFKCESNYWYEQTENNAWELIEHLLPKYIKNKEHMKKVRREQLLKELKELDEE